MPLPLLFPILIGVGAATAAVGVGKGIKAGIDTKDAKVYNRWANNAVTGAKDSLEVARKASSTALEALGGKKLFVLDKSISRFIASFEKLKNVQLEDSAGMEELYKFRLDKQSFSELKDLSGYASSMLGGTVVGAVGGSLAAFGAYSAAMTFGAASTGTAIGLLSGAAATNATLAFLGGGSLAIGGLGMAGGMMVLGGLVAGPALAIMGFIVGATASANLDKAKSNYAEATKAAEEMKAASVLCNGIRRRSYMFERLLVRLEVLFIPLVFTMETVIAEKSDDWNNFSEEDKHTVAAAASIAKAIKIVLDTPILTEDGKITEDSALIGEEMGNVIESYKNS
jgi:phosphohistidine swiveling domain-containing protein